MATLAVTGRADLTDAQWAVLEPQLPRGKKPGRPPERTKRQLIDGIRWRTRTGAPWRDVPPAYGPWQTVYGLFRRWQRNGTWRAILTSLQGRADAAGLITWDVSVDSTVARAHQHAAGARRRGDLQGRAARRCAGRARRSRAGPLPRRADHQDPPGLRAGPKTAIGGHHRRAARRQPAVPGRAGPDPRSARPGCGRPRTRPGRVLADKAYGSRANRAYLRRRGICCTIPEKGRPGLATARPGASAGGPARPVVRPGVVQAAATPWNAASTGSSATGPWPPGYGQARRPLQKPPSCIAAINEWLLSHFILTNTP